VENVDPQLLPQLLQLDEDEVIVPLKVKREDVNKLKAVKLSDEEVIKVNQFQTYLADRKYIPDNNFAALFVYLFNLAFTRHKQAAEEEAKQEVPV